MSDEYFAIRLAAIVVTAAQGNHQIATLARVRNDRSAGTAEASGQQVRRPVLHDTVRFAGPAKLVWQQKPVGAKSCPMRFAAQLTMAIESLKWFGGDLPCHIAAKAATRIVQFLSPVACDHA